MTLAEVGDLVGLSHSQVCRIEQGESTDRATAERLAELFADDGITELHILYPHRYAA